MEKQKKLHIGRPPKAPGTHVQTNFASAKITKATQELARRIAFYEDVFMYDVWDAAMREYAKLKGYVDE